MDFEILTIFPEMVTAFREHGIVRRAIAGGLITVRTRDVRDYAEGPHRVTDDRPYGGGCGMVMKPEPLAAAIRSAKASVPEAWTILLTPQGRGFDQSLAAELGRLPGLILVCGRYEGVDERIGDCIDGEISIGDYILTGGELAAMIIIDAVTRLLPGSLGHENSAAEDSLAGDRLKHAQFTRPRSFEGREVPAVLLSGHHREIEKWRLESALIRTFLKRRDLLDPKRLDPEEIAILQDWGRAIENIVQAQTVCGADPLSGKK